MDRERCAIILCAGTPSQQSGSGGRETPPAAGKLVEAAEAVAECATQGFKLRFEMAPVAHA